MSAAWEWGSHVTVHLEQAQLTPGSHVMHARYGDRVRAAYDPEQITEDKAIAHLCRDEPDLVRHGYQLLHTASR